jgi:hypothetical protein
MSEIVANLDAALAEYRASHAQIARSIVIFGREWDLVPELTTTTANTLAQVVSFANDPEGVEANAMQALIAVADVLPTVIADEVREEFRAEWIRHGVPLGALELIVEAVMRAFTAAPFSQETPTEESALVSPVPSSVSGSSPTPTGAMSNPPSPAVPMPSPPVGMQIAPATDAALSGAAAGGS